MADDFGLFDTDTPAPNPGTSEDEKGLFTVRGEMDSRDECHAAVRAALLKRITDL